MNDTSSVANSGGGAEAYCISRRHRCLLVRKPCRERTRDERVLFVESSPWNDSHIMFSQYPLTLLLGSNSSLSLFSLLSLLSLSLSFSFLLSFTTRVHSMGVARVNGVLAVSRAFGNRTLRSVIRPDAEMIQRDLCRYLIHPLKQLLT